MVVKIQSISGRITSSLLTSITVMPANGSADMMRVRFKLQGSHTLQAKGVSTSAAGWTISPAKLLTRDVQMELAQTCEFHAFSSPYFRNTGRRGDTRWKNQVQPR
jgi:hypothetical protein